MASFFSKAAWLNPKLMAFFGMTKGGYGLMFLGNDLQLLTLVFGDYLHYFLFRRFLYIHHYLELFALVETVYSVPYKPSSALKIHSLVSYHELHYLLFPFFQS